MDHSIEAGAITIRRATVAMEHRRAEAIATLEDHLVRLMAGRTHGQAIANVWADGYARGWRDRSRECECRRL